MTRACWSRKRTPRANRKRGTSTNPALQRSGRRNIRAAAWISYGRASDGSVTAITASTEEGEDNGTQTLRTCGLVTEVRSGKTVVNYEYDQKRRLKKVKLGGALGEYVSQKASPSLRSFLFGAIADSDTTTSSTKIDWRAVLESAVRGGVSNVISAFFGSIAGTTSVPEGVIFSFVTGTVVSTFDLIIDLIKDKIQKDKRYLKIG